MSAAQEYAQPVPLISPTGQCVRETRARYNLSHEAAAELVHVSSNAWYKWEAGSRQMDLARWELFLIKLGERTP